MSDRNLKSAPRVGMGCWAIGGMFWNGNTPVGYSGSNDADSTAAIHAAWDNGVRVFDTSSVYGGGHSETLLGAALKTRPEALIVSKFGHSINNDTKKMTGPKFDPAYVRWSVEQSLQRLQRDQIDVMLLHLNDLPITDATPAFDTLETLVAEGKLASYGWSTDFPERINAVANHPGFSTVQHVMNLFFDAPSMNAAAQKQNVTQLIRSPLAMGLLTGKYTDGHTVPKQDVRANDADTSGYFKGRAAKPELTKQLDAVRDLITIDGRTLTQGALCWLLAKSPNALPLPGAKNAAQSRENALAMEFGPLPDAIMAEIETVLDRPAEEIRAR